MAVPTLPIWDSHDDLVPLSPGRPLHARLAGLRLLMLEGSKHFCMFDQPHILNTALLTFLQGQEVGVSSRGLEEIPTLPALDMPLSQSTKE